MPAINGRSLGQKHRATLEPKQRAWDSGMPKIDRDGVKIHYEVHGSGPPLILTHGFSSTSEMWRGQIEALSKNHTIVLWDMRGHGQSDYPDDPQGL
jgi:pimeloyl-ACP methyl ester carboxylesterase